MLRKNFLSLFMLVALLLPSAVFLNAEQDAEPTLYEENVRSINLTGDGENINWETDGYSERGFKVVWSKNENPTYPLRDGDKYHYYTSPNKDSDTLEAFDGSGTYYVRVCEYLGGKCGLYSNEIEVDLGQIKPCTKEYMPVCAKIDGEKKTYSNKCMMENAGADYLYSGKCEREEDGGVSEINLEMEGQKALWESNGYSAKGYKVVWSKNENPTYPLRDGDKYNYHPDPSSYYSKLTPFDGAGTYYVRVCEYLGGECGVYSNQVKVEMEMVACTMEYAPVCAKDGKTYSNKCMAEAAGTAKAYYGECTKDEQIKDIEEKAGLLNENKLDAILSELKQLRNQVKEQQNEIKYLKGLVSDMGSITQKMQDSINNFITYGVDDNTSKLGEGERAAVIYSYKNAFNKLPESEDELADAIKIANGRWPSKTSAEAEERAMERFRDIYLRYPDMDNANDNAAVTIMAYGLRQKAENRNLESEKAGIEIFRGIYQRTPQSTEDWNTMQAITYSGARR